MKKLFTSFFLFLFVLGALAQEKDPITIVDKAAFKSAIETNTVQLVDVRTPEEYKNGHIAYAINIDFLNPDYFSKAIKELNKEKPVFLYCHSGGRSHKAALLLEEMGFKEIYDLKGGYSEW